MPSGYTFFIPKEETADDKAKKAASQLKEEYRLLRIKWGLEIEKPVLTELELIGIYSNLR